MQDQNYWVSDKAIHRDLIAAKDLVYDPCGLKCSQLLMEVESAEYGACAFEVNDLSVRFRIAKITPTKIGQFVTMWKRIDNGPIQPYDVCDPFDLFVVSTRKNSSSGQFVFPKTALYEHGIISENGKGGKRAMRVYPPWDETINKQAQKTQKWQLLYFLEIPQDKPIDSVRSKMLYATHQL
ncbi:MAG: MepB family protein [Alphaproteobacteria bacterium]